jgi:F-type H+-transporting ATPase subunit b
MFEDPTFWTALAFVVFVIAVFKPIKRSLFAALDKRADQIRLELDEAARLREETQKTLAEIKRKQSEASKEAEALMEHTKVEAERMRKQAEGDLAAALKRREEAALEKIAQAEAQALKEVRDQAVDIAVAATAKLLADNIDQAKADSLVDEAIRDVGSKLH